MQEYVLAIIWFIVPVLAGMGLALKVMRAVNDKAPESDVQTLFSGTK